MHMCNGQDRLKDYLFEKFPEETKEATQAGVSLEDQIIAHIERLTAPDEQ